MRCIHLPHIAASLRGVYVATVINVASFTHQSKRTTPPHNSMLLWHVCSIRLRSKCSVQRSTLIAGVCTEHEQLFGCCLA